MGHFEGGILSYGVASNELGYSFRGINTYRFFPYLTLGIGIGYEQYMLNEIENKKFKFLPLFVQAKYILTPEKSKSLFGAFDLGHGRNLNKNEETYEGKKAYKGGVLASPQIGFLWNSKTKKEYFSVSLGYKYQVLKQDVYYNFKWMEGTAILPNIDNEILQGYDVYTNDKYGMHRLSIMLGIGF